MEEVVALKIPSVSEHCCPNCAAPLQGLYCAVCGQRQRAPHEMRLRHFLAHVIREFFLLDSRLLKSFGRLLFKPGELTLEWIRGRERSYVKPLQLFLFVNLIYFLFLHIFPAVSTLTVPLEVQDGMQPYSPMIQPIIAQKLKASTLKRTEFKKVYDETSADLAKTIVIVMVPFFAIVLSVLFFWKRRYVVEHLVFGLHFYAFFLFLISIVLMLIELAIDLVAGIFRFDISRINFDDLFTYIPAIIIFTYLLFALRKVYGGGKLATAIRAFVLTYSVLYILFLYRFILFFATIYTMKA